MNCMYVKGKKNTNNYLWARFGDKEKPGVECSSKGHKHYSAMYALMPDGRSIEAHYQCDVKGYNPGGQNWRLFKGKPPKNPQTNLWEEYLKLWRVWAANNPDRIDFLVKLADHAGCLLTDQFATTPVNQARALAHILNNRIG